jgi:hypothetical protein
VKKIFLSYPDYRVRPATHRFSRKIVFHCWIKLSICSVLAVFFMYFTKKYNVFYKYIINATATAINACNHILLIKFWWYRTMLNLCGIVAAISKMATGRNLSMSGINSGHHYLPTYTILMISDNVEFLPPILKMADISKIFKTQNCSTNGDLSLCQIVCLYHYLFRSVSSWS